METALILIAYILIYFIWQRQKNKTIDENDEDKENLLRYRIRMGLLPNSKNIIKKFSQSAGMPYDEYLEYFEKNKNIEIDYQESIFYASEYFEGFGYIIFMDKGMEQIWSEKSKTFVNEIEVRGPMFSVKFSEQIKILHSESPYEQAIKFLVATPNQLGFARLGRGVDPEGILAEIPFDEILSFFEDLYKNEGNTACKSAIKSFPKELIDEFKKHNVTYNKSSMEDYGLGCSEKDFNYNDLELYSDWAKNNNIEVYEQILQFHQFDAEYYSIFLNFEFYK